VHEAPAISETQVRVNYSETDQMGVVYHGRYVVWLDVARTEHLRQAGFSYKELEAEGIRLVVTDLRVRYRAPARYDDLVRIRCWVRDVASRRVIFGYTIEDAVAGTLFATAETDLICLDRTHQLSRLPAKVREALVPIADPVRL
jgi:acyl-CoA thioester hydrolase